MMKTVHDIYLEAIAMRHDGLRLREIVDRLVDIGHDNGFFRISERGGPNVAELTFTNGEVIYFDGKDWHHVPLAPDQVGPNTTRPLSFIGVS